MKLFTGLCLGLLLSVPAMAQTAHEGVVRFKKADYTGVMAEYDAPQDQTEGALLKSIEGANLGKGRTEKGFWKYEAVSWPDITPAKADIYFNVERHDGKSVVYMLVSLGNENFVTPASDAATIERMKVFLNGFQTNLAAYQRDEALAKQQEAVKDADRKLKEASRDNDRAARRQQKADRERAKMQEKADDQQRKLEELQGGKK